MYDRIRIRRNNRLDYLGFDNAEKKVVFSCKTTKRYICSKNKYIAYFMPNTEKFQAVIEVNQKQAMIPFVTPTGKGAVFFLKNIIIYLRI